MGNIELNNNENLVKEFVEKRKQDFSPEEMTKMLECVEEWKKTGVNLELVSRFYEEYKKVEQNYTSGKKDVEKGVILQKTGVSIDNFSMETLFNDMDNQKNIIDGILKDRYVEDIELNSINYEALRKALFVSFDEKLNKDQTYLQKREDLLNSLLDLNGLYLKRKIEDSNFKPNEKFELLLTDFGKILKYEVNSGISFSETLKGKSLDEKLLIYKKGAGKEVNKKLLIGNIIEEHIVKKGFQLTYGENGKIIVENSESVDISQSNEDISKILGVLSNEDLKVFILKDVIKSSGFDNVDTNYENIITSLLKKHNVVYSNGSSIVFEDVKSKKDEIVSLINAKLNENNKNNQVKKDLKFVLDYINNQTGYSKESVEQANQFSILEKNGYNLSTNKSRENLKKQFGEGKSVNAFMNDIMSLNGGLVGASLVIGSIVCLFMGGKYRKAAIWGIGLAIGLPALEELAHKYGLGDLVNGKKKGIVENALEYFQGVDVNIKGLPDKFQSKYKLMYKENLKSPNRINNQDFAQIFSQLAVKPEVNDLDIGKIKKGLKDKKSLEEILGEGNVPKEYNPGILTSEKETIIEKREIPRSSVISFLELLVSMKEDKDVKVSDLFVSGKTKVDTYMYREDNFNKEATKILSGFPLGTPIRTKLEDIVSRTNRIISFENAQSLVSRESKKEQLQGIIGELNNLKLEYEPNSKEYKAIDKMIGLYNDINNRIIVELESEDLLNEIKSKAGVRFHGAGDSMRNLGNVIIDGIAGIAVYFGLTTDYIPNQFGQVSIGELDNLVSRTEDYINTIDSKSISPEEKKELKKKFQDIIIAIKEKKWMKLKENPANEAQSLVVFGELIDANPEKYLSDLESMKYSMEELKNPFENYGDAAKALIKNFGNIKVLKEIVKVPGDSSVKTKAKELLNYYLKNFKENIINTKNNIKNKLDEINNKLNKKNLDLNGIIELKEEYDALYSSNFDNGKISGFLTEHGIKKSQNILEIIKNYISELENKDLSNFKLDEYEKQFNETDKLLKSKINSLEGNYDLALTIPEDVYDTNNIKNYIEKIHKNRKIVDNFSQINKRLKISQIETNISKLKNIFIDKLSNENVVIKNRQGKITGINENGINRIENLKLNYDIIKDKFPNGLDNTFNDNYKAKILEYTYELFLETAGQLTYSQVTDNQILPIIDFTKEYAKYSGLGNHFKSINTNIGNKKIIDILNELEKCKSINLGDDITTEGNDNIVVGNSVYNKLNDRINETKIKTMKMFQGSSFEIMTTTLGLKFNSIIDKINNF